MSIVLNLKMYLALLTSCQTREILFISVSLHESIVTIWFMQVYLLTCSNSESSRVPSLPGSAKVLNVTYLLCLL